MKYPQWRAVAAISFVLLVFLALAVLQNRNALNALEQSNRSTAALNRAVADTAQISASLQSAVSAAQENMLRGSVSASETYESEKEFLQNSTERLARELQPFPELAGRAVEIQQQTDSLLATLDPLAALSVAGYPSRPLSEEDFNTRVRRPASELQNESADMQAAVHIQLADLNRTAATAARTNLHQLMLGLLAMLGFVLAASLALLMRGALRARSEAQRAEAINLHEAILRSSPQMILTCDLDGTVRSMNPAAESLFRDTESAVLHRGNKLRDFLVAGEDFRLIQQLTHQPDLTSPHLSQDPDDLALVRAFTPHWENTPLTRLAQWPLQFRCSDGSSFRGLASFAPLRGLKGEITGFLVLAGDFTMSEYAEDLIQEIEDKSRDLFDLNHQKESILNAAAEGIFGLDPMGATLFANPAAAALVHATPEELVSHDLHKLIHGNRPGGLAACAGQCSLVRALQGGEISTAQDILFQRGGAGVPIEFSAAPMLEHGRNVGTVVSIRDISQRDALDRMKDEFVSTVSHELRTPLTSIRGALGLLNTGLMGNIPEKASNLLRIAVSNTDRLVRLINDVLDLERMESGRAVLHFRNIDLCDLIQQAVETMRPMAEAAQIQIHFDARHCECDADPDRIVQVFTNLLSNAIKFSAGGSHINISISPGEEILSISVSDQGRGVPQDKLESVFDRFQQVDATDSRQKGGTGLGLAICRSILQQHGGRIWAERNMPQGTTFRMVVPRSQMRNTQHTLNHDTYLPLPLLEQTILICDDDPIARSMVRHHLQQHGYRVIEAESGERTLELAHQQPLDAILLDLFMPGMNGWETLNRLKSDAATAGIPVVILSVFSSRPVPESDKIRGWISKPFNEQSLLHALGAALQPDSPNSRILLVENDDDHAALITATFTRSGLAVERARNRTEAVQFCQRIKPQLMVLNLSLPNDDGMQIVAWLRQHYELHKLPLVVYAGKEPSNADLDLITQGPAQFLAQASVQPAEVAQLVLNMLRRQRDTSEAFPPGNSFPQMPIFGNTEVDSHLPIV